MNQGTGSLIGTKVLISSYGTRGDVQPFIGIALELKKRGAEVVFLLNDYFEPLITRYGLGFVSIGTKAQYIEFHSDRRIWDPKIDICELGFRRIIRPAIEVAYSYVEEEYKNNENLLIIGLQPLCNGAMMAAEKYSIPSVAVTLSPNYIFSRVCPSAPLRWLFPKWFPQNIKTALVRKIIAKSQKIIEQKDYFWELNGMRRVIGLGPIKDNSIERMFPKQHLQLGLFPGWFGMPASDWPTNLNMTGFPLFEDIKPLQKNTSVEQFIQKYGAPILFTSGTGVYDLEEMFLEGKKICEDLDVPGLFVGDDNSIKQHFQTEKCLYVDYVDFNYVFPECRLIVHHGGIGTLAQALKAGVPQFIRPLAFDQHDNADKIFRLGLGAYALPKQFKAKKVVSLIKNIIESNQIKFNINLVAANIRMNDTTTKVCELIEDWIADSKKSANNIPKNTIGDDVYIAQNESYQIPLIRKKNRRGGELECIAMMLAYHQKQSPKIASLRKQYREFCRGMSLADIHNILTDHDITYRTIQCEPNHLSELRLPCLIQWGIAKFVVLVGLYQDRFFIRDPSATKQIYQTHELQWYYTGVALEVIET